MELETVDLSMRFEETTVLDGVSLRLPSDRVTAVIGPSGGGKSTLLRILAGLLRPSGGSLLVDGRDLGSRERDWVVYRRRVGVVFQSFNLFPHLTNLENVALPLRVVHQRSAEEAAERAAEWLARFQLEEHARKKPGQLSGGQRQRVAIARSLASGPDVLFLDEPTSALDPEMTAEVLDLLLELRREGFPFLVVTHEMAFAREVADEVLLLADGKVLEAGPPEAVMDQPSTETGRRFLKRMLCY